MLDGGCRFQAGFNFRLRILGLEKPPLTDWLATDFGLDFETTIVFSNLEPGV